MKKKLPFVVMMPILITSLCSFSTFPSAPVESKALIQTDKTPGDIKVQVNQQILKLDAPPMMMNGRTLIPLRGVFETLDATVSWQQEVQTVVIQKKDISVQVKVGSSTAVVNGKKKSLDQPAVLKNGRVFVPLRFVSETIGAQVSWDSVARKVIIHDERDVSAVDKSNQPIKKNLAGFVEFAQKNNGKDFFERTIAYEDPFSANEYQGQTNIKKSFEYKAGSIPILISAPHATKHLRKGEVKAADIYTGSMGLILQEFTDAHLLYTTKLADDANYVIGGEYKAKLKEIVQENKIKIVIDLHGAANNRNFDVDVGTVQGASLSSKYEKKIQEILNTSGIKNVTLNGTFAASHEGTIANYSHKELGIAAVQLEISRDYRNPRENLESFATMIKSLIQIIEYFKNEYR